MNLRNVVWGCFLVSFFCVHMNLYGQGNTQTIRGQVTDAVSYAGVGLVNVQLVNDSHTFGAETDDAGKFRFENIPPGRYSLTLTHVGYYAYFRQDILLESGKPLSLQLEMKPAATELQNVVISDREMIHPLASNLSVIDFNMEMSDRIPATFYDPARIITGYPGISIQNDQSNNISIRGNSPNDLVWRIEGLNFVNPNHLTNAGTFSDRPSVSGGGVSILSAQLIRKSSLLTGAFPAEYANALSGVFDIRMREGNSESSAFTLQAGLLGLEAGAEGPFSAGSSNSFLVNYRYSTIGLLSGIGVGLGDESINFQDLSFKLDFDLGRSGKLTFFGLGGLSDERFDALPDSTAWESIEDRISTSFDSDMGGTGLVYKQPMGPRSSLTTRISYSRIGSVRKGVYLSDQYLPEPSGYDSFIQGLLSMNSELNVDLGNYLMTIGMYADRQDFNLLSELEGEMLMEGIGSYWIQQPYFRIERSFSDKWFVDAGINWTYHSLRGKSAIGPRFAVSWMPDASRSFTLQYGLVNKTQIPQAYYVIDREDGGLPNRGLLLTQSHQLVVGYEQRISNNTLLKFEGYVQKHFNVPVSTDPENPYSVVNAGDAFINEILVNRGTAFNRGIEITLNRNFFHNFYVLANVSLYRSTYKAIDDAVRNTRFNGQYGLNVTAGKEFVKNKGDHQRVIGINLRGLYHGGPWETPINEKKSQESGYPVYEQDLAFTDKLMDFFRMDLGIYLKKNRKQYTRSIILGIQNLTNRQNIAYRYYDTELNKTETKYQLGIIPSLIYRVEF